MNNPHPAQVFTAQWSSTICAACHQRITQGAQMVAANDIAGPNKWKHVRCPTNPDAAMRGAAAVRAAIAAARQAGD